MATDGTDVKPDSVSDFGLKTFNESLNFAGAASQPLGTAMMAMPGISGIIEGVHFGHVYRATVEKAGMFVTDATTGLTALGNGAMSIAQKYREADMSQAQQMNAVNTTFSDGLLASYREKRRKELVAAARGALPWRGQAPIAQEVEQNGGHPHAASATPASDPVSSQPQPASPTQQVEAHQSQFGHREAWVPDPYAKPKGLVDVLSDPIVQKPPMA